MRARRYLTRFLAALLCTVALLLWYARSPLRSWVELKAFEHQMKANVDPMELQQWATNWIAMWSGQTMHGVQYYGQNFHDNNYFPSGLKKVGWFSGGIQVYAGGSDPSVTIFALTKGGPFVVVGAPSFVYSNNMTFILWKPGIYFVEQ